MPLKTLKLKIQKKIQNQTSLFSKHNHENDKDDVPGKVDEKATQLHAIASLKVLLDATKPQRGGATTSAANHVKINLKETTLADRPNGNIDTTLDSVSTGIFNFNFNSN